jgi:hypothetical protein
MNEKEKLLSHVTRLNDSSCWFWRGQVSNSGYGRVMLLNEGGEVEMMSAHYASYKLFKGPLQNNKKVIQSCGNRLCVNPEHLCLENI